MDNHIVDKFTTHLKNVLTRALCFVVENGFDSIHPVHLLWALGTQKGCIGAEVMHKAKITPSKLRAFLGSSIKRGAVGIVDVPPVDFTPRLSEQSKRAIEKAVLTANIYEHRYVGTEHLLSGLLQIKDAELERFWNADNVDAKELKRQIAIVLKSTSKFPDLAQSIESGEVEKELQTAVVREPAEKEREEIAETVKLPALDFFARELTTKDFQKKLDPVIGRDSEIQRVMEILSRRTKNNPILLGEPGVGKTAIVEGLAKRIYEGHVPPALRGKRIFALDMALLIAGTMYRGEFEGRLKQIIDEVKEHKDLILFIDEVHSIVGAGSASGSLDAANILKPALARGEIRCVGATTPAEYKKTIETDSALERRFQGVPVSEPTPESARLILEGVVNNYEEYHNVHIEPQAIEAAVSYSVRYLQDKFLPDKALDLIDEAAAAQRVAAGSCAYSEKLRELETQIAQAREKKRTAVIEERFIDAVSAKEEEETLLKAAQECKEKEKQTETTGVVTKEDVARVVSRMTGISLSELITEEKEQLANLENMLSQKIVGQDDVVHSVASSVRRAKTGVTSKTRPLASFLFLGPSGVGKTELARVLSETIFKDKNALITLDMSEYAEGFTVSKLIGAPAGYIGYREGAKLTDQVKQKQYAVVLFDELEKAHRDVQNLLLQILEKGELADSTGRKINFKNTIIIMTSNVGLEKFEGNQLGFGNPNIDAKTTMTEEIKTELEERFRPELLNRVDSICLFQKLNKENLAAIARLQLDELAERLLERNINFIYEFAVATKLAEIAKNDKVGAREIRRLIQTNVESLLAEKLLKTEQIKEARALIQKDEIKILLRK